MSQLQKNVEFLDKSKASCLNLGERLKLARIMLRKPQKAFGEILNCSQSVISAYELNIHRPKKDFFNLCAEIYNINPNYLTRGIEPIFLKKQAELVKIEVIDKAQNALTNKDKTKPKPKTLKPELDCAVNDDEAYSALQPNKALAPITPNPSYNIFSFKDIELDIIVYESNIYYSFAHISKIVGVHLVSDLMFCVRTFSQNELKNASFRTFKEFDKYYKDEVYVEYKAFMACYKGHKNKDIVAFLEYAKHLESNLVQYYSQNIKLDGEYDIVLFEKMDLGKIRVKGDSENPFFCLNDIAKILGIQNSSQLASAIEKEFGKAGKGVYQIYPLTSFGGLQQFTFITEPQLYFVIMRSDKPKARALRQWVINEVLPSIRKGGKYEYGKKAGNVTSNPLKHEFEGYEINSYPLQSQNSQTTYDKALTLALSQINQHQKLIEQNKNLTLENERYKSLFKREGEFSIAQTAKILQISTFELKNFLIKEKLITNYPKTDKQYPTQYAKDNGYIKMKLTDTRKVVYELFITLPLIDKLKEFFVEA